MATVGMEVLAQHAHRKAMEAPIEDVATYLQSLLSRRLVAYVAGVKDAKSVSRWASGEVEPREDSEQRLRVAFEITQLLIEFDSPRIIKAWFIGLNPQLGDTSPAEALHEGQLKEVKAAARAFIAGG